LRGIVLCPIRFDAGEERLTGDVPGKYAVGEGAHVGDVLAVERPAVERRAPARPRRSLIEVSWKDGEVGIRPRDLLNMVNALVVSRERSHLDVGPRGANRIAGEKQAIFGIEIGRGARRMGRDRDRANQPVAQVDLAHCSAISVVCRATAFANGDVVRWRLRRPV